jgi:hypothetical protein
VHDKLQVQCKLEKVKEILVEAWLEIRKVAPELPEVSDVGEPEHQIEFLQGAWMQLTTQVEQLKAQLQQAQQEKRSSPRSCRSRCNI